MLCNILHKYLLVKWPETYMHRLSVIAIIVTMFNNSTINFILLERDYIILLMAVSILF